VVGIVLNEVSKEDGYYGGYGYGYGSYQPDLSQTNTPAQANGHPDAAAPATTPRSHRPW
jgi:hypothetical protein